MPPVPSDARTKSGESAVTMPAERAAARCRSRRRTCRPPGRRTARGTRAWVTRPFGWIIRRASIRLLTAPCWRRSATWREAAGVGERGVQRRSVLAGVAGLARRAERHVALLRELPARRGAARRPGRRTACARRARAVRACSSAARGTMQRERHLHRVVLDPLRHVDEAVGLEVGGLLELLVAEARADRAALLVEVARDGHRAGDLAREQIVLAGLAAVGCRTARTPAAASSANRGAPPLICRSTRLLSPRTANALSRISSDALGDVARAGDREVPREVELLALDAGLGERREVLLERRGAGARATRFLVCSWSRKTRNEAGALIRRPFVSRSLLSATM